MTSFLEAELAGVATRVQELEESMRGRKALVGATPDLIELKALRRDLSTLAKEVSKLAKAMESVQGTVEELALG